MAERITIARGDITAQPVDAIVNAANNSLLGGGGVDGAIHRAAGPGLLEECRALGGCPTGEARLTGGHGLTAKWVVHTVGPIWQGGTKDEHRLLAKCYQSVFALAGRHRMKSIAFPAISTGAYGFPADQACRIAIREARKFLDKPGIMEKVVFVCFDAEACQSYQEALKEVDTAN